MRRAILLAGVILACSSVPAHAGPVKILKKGFKSVGRVWSRLCAPPPYMTPLDARLSDMQSQIDFNTATNMSNSIMSAPGMPGYR